MSENKRFEELSKLNRNDLLDLQNKILKNLEESFNSKGNQILLEEDKNTWTTILEETTQSEQAELVRKDIETENIDLIRQIMFKEKILKIQLKEANKLN